MSSRMSSRNQEMHTLYAEGWTYREIGERYGVAKQRVHQVIDPTPEMAAAHLAAHLAQSPTQQQKWLKAEQITQRRCEVCGVPVARKFCSPAHKRRALYLRDRDHRQDINARSILKHRDTRTLAQVRWAERWLAGLAKRRTKA